MLLPKEIEWKAGRQAHQRAFIIAVCAGDVMAGQVLEHAPLSISYECREDSMAKLRVHTGSSLRAMSLL